MYILIHALQVRLDVYKLENDIFFTFYKQECGIMKILSDCCIEYILYVLHLELMDQRGVDRNSLQQTERRAVKS